MPSLRFYRAIWIGLALGLCTSAVIYWASRTKIGRERLREIRPRVEPVLKKDLSSSGFALGEAAFIRIFKEELQLELWLRAKGENRYRLWKTWPIAGMSGKLGPKLKTGDGQAPEGFYATNSKALNPQSDFHLSFNVGYPNAYDQAQGRTGSFIMVHGRQSSIGCFAMTDPVIEQIYLVVEAALRGGQSSVPIHVFPFRMTDERMAQAESSGSPWLEFWKNLREGYDRFEKTGVPPLVKGEGGRYKISSQD